MDGSESSPLLSGWDLVAAASLLALAGYYVLVGPLLPDPVPTHFDALGRANGWTAKAHLPWVIFAFPVLGWLVLLGTDAAAGRTPAGSGLRRALQAFRGLLTAGLAFLMGGCLAVPILGLNALLAGVAVFLVGLGLGLVALMRASGRAIARRPHPEHYRWGVFYVNPEDPRLWVEKRLGMGWTLNYARPAALWITVLLAAPALVAVAAVVGHFWR